MRTRGDINNAPIMEIPGMLDEISAEISPKRRNCIELGNCRE